MASIEGNSAHVVQPGLAQAPAPASGGVALEGVNIDASSSIAGMATTEGSRPYTTVFDEYGDPRT